MFLPTSATNNPLPEATVIAVGPGAPNKDGKVIPTSVKAGDRVLCEVAKRLQQGVRQIDLVARVGGDEFVVLLPGCDAEHARDMAQQLCQQLRVRCTLGDGPLPMHASIGIATFPADGQTPDALLAHADKAMYASRASR